jgi:hypothetical protein
MKNISNLSESEVQALDGFDIRYSDEPEFRKSLLRVEGAWRYIVGGTSAIAGALIYADGHSAGYALLAAGLATYMNGRSHMEEAENL